MYNKAEIFTDTGKVTVADKEYDENYSITRSINYVKNSGIAFVEAIYDVVSESVEELELNLGVYDKDGKVLSEDKLIIIPSSDGARASLKLDVRNYTGEVTVKSSLVKKVDKMAVLAECERRINLTGSFADPKNITVSSNSKFYKSTQVGIEYIKSIDVDKLLAPSYDMHGLTPPNGASRYGGWERKGASNWGGSAQTFTLAGHSLGHWMSAAAVFYRDTQNEIVLEKLNYAVSKLNELQKRTNSGYIGGCEETCFINLFNGNTSSWCDGYWVPWYGVHKIYQGLLDTYDYTGNTVAFDVLKRFSDWAVNGLLPLSDSQMQEMLKIEYGGMNEIFARMYEITGEDKYLTVARRFTHDEIINPLINKMDALKGYHANTQIPKIVGAAEIYEQDSKKYGDYKAASKNFLDFVINNRSYVIGGNSIAEHFEALGAESLGVKTCESCNTYNMMRLCEHLFDWERDSKYMDWYENALYNHILGQQDPKTGEKMYFVSLLQGHHRVYEEKDKSWWCCTGTGMENPGRYTRCMYFEDGNDLYVNLYMPGDYKWESKGLNFRVETNYPYSQNIKIRVFGNDNANINLRAPQWLEKAMTVKVGDDVYSSDGGEFLVISRGWSDGDVMEINIPMRVRTYKSRTVGQIAYQYGPLTLAAALGSVEGVEGVNEYISNETIIDSVTADVPYIMCDIEDPSKIVTMSDTDTLKFKIDGKYMSNREDMELIPFSDIHHQFYNVYWNLNVETSAYLKKLNDISIDAVEPDGQQDEIGHALNSKNSNNGNLTVGEKMYYWRDAWGSADAYFEYTMQVDSRNQNYLFVRYYGNDSPFNGYTRDFNILVDSNVIAEQTLNIENSDGVYEVFYKIPQKYTDGKESVVVRLAAKNASTCAGGVLGIRITREDLSKNL